jgi:hypothetical protein
MMPKGFGYTSTIDQCTQTAGQEYKLYSANNPRRARMKIELKSFVVGILLGLSMVLFLRMADTIPPVGRYTGWGDVSQTRYMLDTSNGQLYVWKFNKGWKKQASQILP